MSGSRVTSVLLGLALGTGFLPAHALEINEFVSPVPAVPAAGVWYETLTVGAGTASIVDLTGQGGNLENNQPLPTGAALLTTGADNGDRAEVAVFDNYGTANSFFSSGFSASYDYLKASNPGQNTAAAPSLKFTLWNPFSCTQGDCFGTLIYEPYWNQASNPGASVDPPLDTWQTESIDLDNGLFSWSGGFGPGNTAGGPPLSTLSEWLGLFNTPPFDADFAGAILTSVSVGVGSFNQSQIGYFDNVQLAGGNGYTAMYDFESADVPAPATVLLFLLGLSVLRLSRRN